MVERRSECERSPAISAIVCTRSRGASIVSTVESILSNDHPCFELVIIDQSLEDDTEEAIRPFMGDSRIRYVRSDKVGKGHALNQALEFSTGAIIAITDDDVTVPVNWLTVMAKTLVDHPDAAVVFCNVVAAPHDRSAGFVPGYVRLDTVEVATMRSKCRARGIGAGIAVKRQPIVAMGGFDPLLGPGGPLGSTDDRDLAIRSLLAGWHVVETNEVEVVHDGFRTWSEGRDLTRRDWFGMGTSLAKPIRVGRFDALIVVLWEGIVMALLHPLVQTIREHRLSGLKQAWYFWHGFVVGLRHPLNRETMCFEPDKSRTTDSSPHRGRRSFS